MRTPTPAARTATPLLIAFADLTRYAAQSQLVDDAVLADVMDGFYERVSARVEGGGGRVVKFIGDAALIVFPADAVDQGIEALLALKPEIDDWFAERDWACRLIVKVHFGEVIAGAYGGQSDKRFDVLGKTVNAAALLDSTGVALSADAFRKLSPTMRQRFKKHTPPICYIRLEDPHRDRRR